MHQCDLNQFNVNSFGYEWPSQEEQRQFLQNINPQHYVQLIIRHKQTDFMGYFHIKFIQNSLEILQKNITKISGILPEHQMLICDNKHKKQIIRLDELQEIEILMHSNDHNEIASFSVHSMNRFLFDKDFKVTAHSTHCILNTIMMDELDIYGWNEYLSQDLVDYLFAPETFTESFKISLFDEEKVIHAYSTAKQLLNAIGCGHSVLVTRYNNKDVSDYPLYALNLFGKRWRQQLYRNYVIQYQN